MKIKTKYGGLLEWDDYKEQLIKNVFKILPLMEEKRDWKRYLAGLLTELAGLEDLSESIEFTSLNGKLNGLFLLSKEEISDGQFRKTVFDSMDLIKKIKVRR